MICQAYYCLLQKHKYFRLNKSNDDDDDNGDGGGGSDDDDISG